LLALFTHVRYSEFDSRTNSERRTREHDGETLVSHRSFGIRNYYRELRTPNAVVSQVFPSQWYLITLSRRYPAPSLNVFNAFYKWQCTCYRVPGR